MRGLSALDVALWDILAQAANLPLYRVLGAARERIRIYNSCGGPTYSRGRGLGHGPMNWPRSC
jgi:L-alanine-DL-glutamate epimerase-like enolase superfamily enzyme